MAVNLTRISPDKLLSLFQAREEFALLDLLEEGEFSVTPHLIQATNIPLSILEIQIQLLVPHRETQIILAHNLYETAVRAADTLTELGYSKIFLLETTIGLELYTGFNVKSKAFGEVVEHHYSTPTQDAKSVKEKIDNGTCILIDVRPHKEFSYETIPGAYNVTGPELYDVASRLKVGPGQEVIVNCGGRTRSILGAQSLIEMGVDYPVSSLKNGTMGWHLAGYELEYGASRSAGQLALSTSMQKIALEENGIPEASISTIEGLMARGRTVYFFDMRDQAEAAHLTLPIARFASGVQLIQATDSFCAVQNATVVLIDPSHLRATMVGRWLRRMGIPSTFVISKNIEQWTRIPSIAGLSPIASVHKISAHELKNMLSDHLIIDFSNSQIHRKGHVPGAYFAVRSSINSKDLSDLARGRRLVFYGADETLLNLALSDHAEHFGQDLFVLPGGLREWKDAGGDIETGMLNPLSRENDIFVRPMELGADREQAMQAYLDWEIDLMERIFNDQTVKFEF